MIYAQLYFTPDIYVEKCGKRVDMFYIQRNQNVKKQGSILNIRGEYGRMIRICQNELTNHTHVTVLARTVFVLVLPQRLAALY